MKTYTAFNGSDVTRNEVLERVLAHHAADEIVQGQYWENGKGCFIGCITHNASYKNSQNAAAILGWSNMLVRTAEEIFEMLPASMAKDFARDVVTAAQAGDDVTDIEWRFAYGMLRYISNNSADYVATGLYPAFNLLLRRIVGSTPAITQDDVTYATGYLRGAQRDDDYNPVFSAAIIFVTALGKREEHFDYAIGAGLCELDRVGHLIPDFVPNFYNLLYNSFVGLLLGESIEEATTFPVDDLEELS